MEDLTGGSLTLEQRYEIEKLEGIHAGVHIYRARQFPLDQAVWIHVIPHSTKNPEIEKEWIDRIRSSVLGLGTLDARYFYELIDFGAVEGAPFIVYRRDKGHRLREILDVEGTLDVDATKLICSGLAEACLSLEKNKTTHGSLNPSFIFVGDSGDVRLIHAGLGLSKEELDILDIQSKAGRYAFDKDVNSDAYGIGCIAYELLSGVHPFLDNEGNGIENLPAHPAEFGTGMQFAEIIFDQFDPQKRDLRAFLGTQKKPRVSNESRSVSVNKSLPNEKMKTRAKDPVLPIEVPESSPPKNDFRFWAAAGLVVILAGVLFFQFLKGEGPQGPRPTNLTLSSEPTNSEVSLNGERVGFTPFELDPKMMKEMKLLLKKEGYKSTEIEIVNTGERPIFKVKLQK